MSITTQYPCQYPNRKVCFSPIPHAQLSTPRSLR
jgi:hypothetical protein